MAVTGLLLNFLIMIIYGPEGLGLFNFIFALFIIFSQFSTFGLHYSTLKFSSQHIKKETVLKEILTNSILLSFLFCVPVLLISFVLPNTIFHLFQISGAKDSWYFAIPGLLFFSFNKIILSFINGQRKMHLYAFLTSLRYVGMLMCLGGLIWVGASASKLSLILTVPELLLFIVSLFFIHHYIDFSKIIKNWIKSHFIFSYKSFLAGASIEFSSRVDVLILACFVNERMVGIYSFALFFVEGFLQIIVMFRNLINPLITQCLEENKAEILRIEIKKVGTKAVFLMAVSFLMSLFCYYAYMVFFEITLDISESFYVFTILMLGVILSSYYLPLQFFPAQTGNPSQQTFLNLFFVVANISLNTIFSYGYGLYGAAIATSLNFIITGYVIKKYVNFCLSTQHFAKGRESHMMLNLPSQTQEL